MPARPGQPKGDAGKTKGKRTADGSPYLPFPSARPLIPEIPPLLDTYSQAKPDGAYFSEESAQRAFDFIESLSHYKGRFAGQRFFLLDWQRHLIREIFGWLRADGTRLIRRVYVECPRKNGKTSLAAAVALYLALGDGEASPEISFAAVDSEQAAHGYDASRFMAEAAGLPVIAYNYRRLMLLPDNPGGVIRCLSSETRKSFGANLSGIILDELAQWPNRLLWDSLRTSTGARAQPLMFAITSAGWDRQGVAFEQRERTRQISEGALNEPDFLGVVYSAPDNADWTDPVVWAAANPSLGATIQIDSFSEAGKSAEAIPAEQNSFRTLLLSQWVGQAERWLDTRAWDQCSANPIPASKRAAFLGADLSKGTDLTALVLVAPAADGFFDIHARFFSPEEGLRERALAQRVPLDVWAKQGFLTLTPGETVDRETVRAAIHETAAEWDLREVAYDPWGFSGLVQQLEQDGLLMVQIPQTLARLAPPAKELERLVLERKLRHGANPILRWAVDSCAVVIDGNGNKKPDRKKSSGPIDGVIGLLLGLDGAIRRNEPARVSVYESRGLLVFGGGS